MRCASAASRYGAPSQTRPADHSSQATRVRVGPPRRSDRSLRMQRQGAAHVSSARMHACMIACAHACVCVCACMHVRMRWHACPHTYMHTWPHTCIRPCIHVSIHASMHPHIHASRHTCVHACMHMPHTQASSELRSGLRGTRTWRGRYSFSSARAATVISHQSSVISHRPSARAATVISHQSSVISHRPSARAATAQLAAIPTANQAREALAAAAAAAAAAAGAAAVVVMAHLLLASCRLPRRQDLQARLAVVSLLKASWTSSCESPRSS